jgi:hypothetical protein
MELALSFVNLKRRSEMKKTIENTHLYVSRRDALLYIAGMYGIANAYRHLNRCGRHGHRYDLMDLPCGGRDLHHYMTYVARSRSRRLLREWLTRFMCGVRRDVAYQCGRLGYNLDCTPYSVRIPA